MKISECKALFIKKKKKRKEGERKKMFKVTQTRGNNEVVIYLNFEVSHDKALLLMHASSFF